MKRPARPPPAAAAAAIAFAAATISLIACGDPARNSPPPASRTRADARPARNDDLPRDYVLVGPAGAAAFASPPLEKTPPAPGARVGSGFGFAVVDERSVASGRYLQIADGRWLPAADVIRATPSTFAGVAFLPGQGPTQLAWVITPDAAIQARPDAAAPCLTTRPAHARLQLAGPCRAGWCPLSVGWIRAADIARPAPQARPPAVGPQDRWLDIDLASQTLMAFEGDRAVYATLVSTGIGEPGSPLATPTGTFTIGPKRRLVRMDNLEHTGVIPYAYDVPLAQYFTDGKALHAALWHDRFGRAGSHGCVNLSPADAVWLFAFTSPSTRSAAGATSGGGVGAKNAGTAVRIRGDLPRVALR
ncbi:MAG: L,D-transpeptidase [Bacteroidota bacterium]